MFASLFSKEKNLMSQEKDSALAEMERRMAEQEDWERRSVALGINPPRYATPALTTPHRSVWDEPLVFTPRAGDDEEDDDTPHCPSVSIFRRSEPEPTLTNEQVHDLEFEAMVEEYEQDIASTSQLETRGICPHYFNPESCKWYLNSDLKVPASWRRWPSTELLRSLESREGEGIGIYQYPTGPRTMAKELNLTVQVADEVSGMGRKKKGKLRKGGRPTSKWGNGKQFSPRVANFASFTVPIVPSMIKTRLRQNFLFTLTGATVVCRRYNPNAVYQPEVGGATATVPGFSELAALYGFYRVFGYSYKAECTNLEAFPVTAIVLNSNNDPGTSAGVIQAANDLCAVKVLSSKGGMDRAIMSGKYTVARVLGSNAVATADSYRSLITGVPADIAWLGIAAQSNTGTSLTLGMNVLLDLTMYVEFYDRLLQT